MTASWKTRVEPKPRSREAREEAADALIAAGDAVITQLAIHEHPAVSAYQRYSGWLSSRYNGHITGHERSQCYSDRDHGAARLIQIYSEQLRHMAPRAPRETGPFADVGDKALSRIGRATTTLCEHAHALQRCGYYHGARYREKAEPLLAAVTDDLREMRLALRSIDAKLHGDDATETKIISHFKGLLDVLEQCHHHAVEMLPSPQTHTARRTA